MQTLIRKPVRILVLNAVIPMNKNKSIIIFEYFLFLNHSTYLQVYTMYIDIRLYAYVVYMQNKDNKDKQSNLNRKKIFFT